MAVWEYRVDAKVNTIDEVSKKKKKQKNCSGLTLLNLATTCESKQYAHGVSKKFAV